MAVSKHTRASGCETNPFFLDAFRDNADPNDDRERMWNAAMSHAGEGNPPLRFPVYGSLYLINIYCQKLVDPLDEACNRFSVRKDCLTLYQSLIQYVRAGASQDILDLMNDVEITEEWLFEKLRRNEERELRDPEDAYFEVRKQELERKSKGLPPRVKFIDENPSADESDEEEASRRRRR
jgi:hypothetical protein